MSTTRELLCQFKGSHLEKAFDGSHPLKMVNEKGVSDEEVFLDRDPEPFQQMVSYLRSDCKVYPHFNTNN
jgi:hypothetical protein